MTRPGNYFESLAGVPVNYDRMNNNSQGYGTRGKPNLKYYCTDSFEEKLQACFEELWSVCPYGKAEVITTAGAWVDKRGMHGKGRGFDLDAIFWKDFNFITFDYPLSKKFYLGVEAVLRRHFGTVLNYLYNSAHKDHFHIDDGTHVRFSTRSESRVLFLQATLTHVLGETVAIDGAWGNETKGAAARAMHAMGIDGELLEEEVWMEFLSAIATQAFADTEAPTVEPTPLELLQSIYEVIEDQLYDIPFSGKKNVEGAVTAFAQHPDVVDWLQQYENN